MKKLPRRIGSFSQRIQPSAIALTLAIQAAAMANIGPPISGGDVVAEPVGSVDVAIEKEVLTLDLRPLEANSLVRVEAVYYLENSGSEKQLDLLFASGSSSVSDFQVSIDGKPIATVPANEIDLPESWKPPRQTPAIDHQGGLPYLSHMAARRGATTESPRITALGFNATIPSGHHQLAVSYRAEASTRHWGHGKPTVYHQFAYILAPARSWSDFGALEVSIRLPQGWMAACTPRLERAGDSLTGSFESVPSDAIAITVQAPAGWPHYAARFSTLASFCVALCAGAVLCWWGGRRNGGRSRSLPVDPSETRRQRRWPRSAAVGIAWALAVLVSGLLSIFAPEWFLPAGQISDVGYRHLVASFFVVVLGIVLFPLGFVIAQLSR